MSPKGAQHAGLTGTAPDKAIKELAAQISSKSKADPLAQAACITCHPDPYAAYKSSIHGQNVMVKKSSDGPVCTSCHGSPHSILARPNKGSKVYLYNLVESCGKCHEEKHISEKYKFSPLVMERYKESFHGRKLKLGHTGAPSCANCHGAHDVKSTKDASSPVGSIENKKKTCSKCHKGATDKFVAAITHKPLHPVAHFAEIALIILTVGTFMFIITHVLLDIFADIRKRLFRKGGDHHE
jgi:nitrate/TMAO reductase-like tetraheme cytochrome c subunit